MLLASFTPVKVKLADFGISKSTAGTDLRTRIGTARYMAPEQLGLLPARLRLGHEYTTAVDMWALGFMVHELLTGRTPFLETPAEEMSLSGISAIETNGTGQLATDMHLVLQFCDGNAVFPLESLQAVDAPGSAMRFIKTLVVPDPRSRLSAAEALLHPWVTGLRCSSETYADLSLEPPRPTPMFYSGDHVVPTPPSGPSARQQSPPPQPEATSDPNRSLAQIAPFDPVEHLATPPTALAVPTLATWLLSMSPEVWEVRAPPRAATVATPADSLPTAAALIEPQEPREPMESDELQDSDMVPDFQNGVIVSDQLATRLSEQLPPPAEVKKGRFRRAYDAFASKKKKDPDAAVFGFRNNRRND